MERYVQRYFQRKQQAQHASASTARSDSDEAHGQSIPAEIEFHRVDTDRSDDLPSLIYRLKYFGGSINGTPPPP